MQEEDPQFAPKAPKIQVVIRKRPLSNKEKARNDIDIIDVRGPQQVVVKEMKQKVDLTKYIEEHNFNFDSAFDENSNNQQIYSTCIRPLVQAVFTNANCTVFAYGQTGSGKTHTMLGNYEKGNPGLYLLGVDDLFSNLQRPQYQHLTVWVSFYEIYCGKLFDLLNDRQELVAREDAKKRVNIVGLQEKKITGTQSILQIIEFGNQVRVTGVNSANSESSRSHAILSITIRENNNTFGKLSFIDLAGSERGADVSDSNKQTRIDGAEINKSLLALKECIRAIDQNKNHTPFRGSKLTQVLRDSFVGNCKTVMIGNIAPSNTSSENTLNTLRYADRVKELKKPTTNGLDQQVSDLDKFQKELMLPRQNGNTKKYAVPNENAFIDYTKGPPQPVKQDSSLNNNSNNLNLNNNNNNGNNLNLNNNINNLNMHLNPNQNNQNNSSNQNSKKQMTNNFFHNKPNQQPQQELFNINNSGSQNSDAMKNNSTNFNMYNNPNNNNQQGNNMELEAQNQRLNFKKPLQNVNINLPSNQTNSNNLQNLNNNNSNLNMNLYNNNNNNNNQQSKNSNAISMNIEQIKNWKAKNEEDLKVLSNKHEQLISQILQEEEEVIAGHRSHIDEMVELVKQEMMFLHEVDKPGSDVDDYVTQLDEILAHKVDIISNLRNRLQNFKTHLKEEEVLSKKFYEQKSQILDVYDLGQQNNNSNQISQGGFNNNSNINNINNTGNNNNNNNNNDDDDLLAGF